MLGKNFNPSFVLSSNSVSSSKEYNQAVLTGSFLGSSRFNPGTQKAKGVFFLQDKGNKIRNQLCYWNVPKHILFRAGTKFGDESFNFPVFARPCPLNPRHGFVDSTICSNAEELNNVSSLTLSADPDAEILVTKPVDSAYNAIINGGVITFGAGNDGATAGRGVNYFYISEDPLSEMLDLNNKKIIAEDETPFYELVFENTEFSNNRVNLVQVRSAPKTPRVKDFVPAPVVVKTILKAAGDLLDWEALLKTVDPATTIVDHTDGSLSSHYAIHAIVNKVPIFTTYMPELGSTVEPTVENSDLNDEDVASFKKAFAAGFCSGNYILSKSKYQGGNLSNFMGNVIRTSLAALHNYSSFAFSKDYSALGMIVGLFCRSAFAISIGETRYNRKRINEKYLGTTFQKYYDKMTSGGRDACYNHMYRLDIADAQSDIYTAYHIFDRMKWDSAYGGKRWANCTKSAVHLFNACASGDIQKVVELLNVVINENHNGGKYLNKVIGQHEFDIASTSPSTFALNSLHNIVDILHNAWQYYKSVNLDELTSKLSPINLDWNEDKALKVVKLVDFYIPATSSSEITVIEWVAPNGSTQVIDLPASVKNTFTECACESCWPNRKFNLHSIPFWIVNDAGERVISKSMLNKILNKMGFANPEIK